MTIAIDLDTHLASNLTALAQQGVANTNNFAHYANWTEPSNRLCSKSVPAAAPPRSAATTSKCIAFPAMPSAVRSIGCNCSTDLLAQSKPAVMRQNIRGPRIAKGLSDGAHLTAHGDPLAAAGQSERRHDSRLRLRAGGLAPCSIRPAR